MTGIADFSGRERVERLDEGVAIIDLLLRQEVSTYEGEHYQVKDAVVEPRPVQQPRPPITIAAIGPAMRKLAARRADTWSFTSALCPLTQDTLQWIRKLIRAMDDLCEQIDRDPTSLRRSVLHFDPDASTGFPFTSKEEFRETAEQVLDIGIDEIILQYPSHRETSSVFVSVAVDVIPALQA